MMFYFRGCVFKVPKYILRFGDNFGKIIFLKSAVLSMGAYDD